MQDDDELIQAMPAKKIAPKRKKLTISQQILRNKNFWGSKIFWALICDFLGPHDFMKMQGLSKVFYKRVIFLAQTSIKVTRDLFFAWTLEGQFQARLFKYNTDEYRYEAIVQDSL